MPEVKLIQLTVYNPHSFLESKLERTNYRISKKLCNNNICSPYKSHKTSMTYMFMHMLLSLFILWSTTASLVKAFSASKRVMDSGEWNVRKFLHARGVVNNVIIYSFDRQDLRNVKI